MTEGKSDFESAELVALADEVAAIACCGTIFMGDDEKLLKAASALRRLAAQDQKPVAWRIRVVDGSYCEVIPKGELEIWKQNWSRHLESGHALLEPLCVGVSPPPAAGWDEGTLARAICHSDNGPGVPSCVMDDHPERDPCNFSNCRRFEQAREVINALHHNAPPDSGAGKSGDATGLIERDIAAQSALARIRKVRDGYANQAKFADVEQASYFREFIRRLDEAVGQKESVPQRVPDHGGADAGVRVKIEEAKLLIKEYNPRESDWFFRRDVLRDVLNDALSAISKPAPVAANASAEARLREALGEIKLVALTAGAPGGLDVHFALSRIVRFCRDAGITETMTEIREALSAHPHASDKQGEL